MKVIILFDGDKLDNIYREYDLDYDEELRDGKMVKISFCHPSHGEQIVAKCVEMLSEESLT